MSMWIVIAWNVNDTEKEEKKKNKKKKKKETPYTEIN